MQKRAALVVAITCCSGPALACSLRLPDADGWTYPFEGAQVPTNSEFRALGAPPFLASTWASTLPMTFDGPGGPVEASVVVDDISAVVVPAVPLTPGAWTLTIEPDAGSADARVVAFELLDEVDDTPPVIDAASAEVRTVGDFFADPDGCGGGRHDELAVSVRVVDDDTAAIAMMVGTSSLGVVGGAEAEMIGTADVESVDVVVIDFAGNRSEPVTVEVARGCSSSSMPLALPLALGLAVRRRRR
jgi:uncharacterized protein (TIGR03382 family)